MRLPNTPLSLAAEKGHIDVVKWLLDMGANIDTNTLIMIIMSNKRKMVALMVDVRYVDINIKLPKDSNLIHYAASLGCEDIIEILIRAGININHRDIDGDTPLDVTRSYRCTILLREHGGVSGRRYR